MDGPLYIFRYLIHRERQLGYMRDADLIEGFFLHCRTKNLSDKTLKCYVDRLSILVEHSRSLKRQLWDLRETDILKYVDTSLQRNAAETVNGRLRAWRVFYNYLFSAGYLDHNPMAGIKNVRSRKSYKHVLTPDDVSRLINACSPYTFLGARDRAMIAVLYDCKLRVGEMVRLAVEDVNFKDMILRVEHDKGGRGRPVGFTEVTAKLLHLYLTLHRSRRPMGRLFCTSQNHPITETHAYRTICRIGQRIGIKVYPHKLRHSGATGFIQNGGAVFQLMLDLGHASVETTQKYIHVNSLQAIPEVRKYSPAYQLKISKKVG